MTGNGIATGNADEPHVFIAWQFPVVGVEFSGTQYKVIGGEQWTDEKPMTLSQFDAQFSAHGGFVGALANEAEIWLGRIGRGSAPLAEVVEAPDGGLHLYV